MRVLAGEPAGRPFPNRRQIRIAPGRRNPRFDRSRGLGVCIVRAQAVAQQADRFGALLGDSGVRGPQLGGQVLDGTVMEIDLLNDVAHLLRQGSDSSAEVLHAFGIQS